MLAAIAVFVVIIVAVTVTTISIIRWTTTVSAIVVIGKVGIAVSVRASWAVVAVVVPAVAPITRSLATVHFVGILLRVRSSTVSLVVTLQKDQAKK